MKANAFDQLSKEELFIIVQTYAMNKIPPLPEYFILSEPFILKNLNQYSSKQIAWLFVNYCRLQVSSEGWLKILLMCVQNEAEKLPFYFIIQILRSLKSDFFMRIMTEKPVKSIMVFLNQAMKNLDGISPFDFKVILNTLHFYNIQEKAYFEILAITFGRVIDKFDMLEKATLIYKLVLPQIDEASIFIRTKETLREYLSILMHNQGLNSEGELDILQLQFEGIFSQRQILFLEEHYMKNQSEVERSQDILQNLNQEKSDEAAFHLQTQTFAFSKLLW